MPCRILLTEQHSDIFISIEEGVRLAYNLASWVIFDNFFSEARKMFFLLCLCLLVTIPLCLFQMLLSNKSYFRQSVFLCLKNLPLPLILQGTGAAYFPCPSVHSLLQLLNSI